MRAVMGCWVLSGLPSAALAPAPASPHRGPALEHPCLPLSPAGGPHLQHDCDPFPYQHVRHRVMDHCVRIVPHAARHRSRAGVGACDQAQQQGLDVTCVEAMRTAFSTVGTSLPPHQGGVRRPPPVVRAVWPLGKFGASWRRNSFRNSASLHAPNPGGGPSGPARRRHPCPLPGPC